MPSDAHDARSWFRDDVIRPALPRIGANRETASPRRKDEIRIIRCELYLSDIAALRA